MKLHEMSKIPGGGGQLSEELRVENGKWRMSISAILPFSFFIFNSLLLPLAVSAALSDWDQTIAWRYDASGRPSYHVDPSPVVSASESHIDLRLRTVSGECYVRPHGALIIFH